MIRPLLRGAKRFLFSRGIEVRRMGIFEQVFRRRLSQGDPFVFVQVGANDGISFDSLFWDVTKANARGIVIEPLGDVYAQLCKAYAAFPNIVPVRLAVHPTDREITLHRPAPEHLEKLPDWARGIASVSSSWHQISGIPADVMIEERVPAAPLMEILDRHGISRVDLLQTDVEGFDAEVIRMVDFDRLRPAIIKYESNHPDTDRIVTPILERRGYQLARVGEDVVAWLK